MPFHSNREIYLCPELAEKFKIIITIFISEFTSNTNMSFFFFITASRKILCTDFNLSTTYFLAFITEKHIDCMIKGLAVTF